MTKYWENLIFKIIPEETNLGWEKNDFWLSFKKSTTELKSTFHQRFRSISRKIVRIKSRFFAFFGGNHKYILNYLINFNFFALNKFLFDIFIHSLSPFVFFSRPFFCLFSFRFPIYLRSTPIATIRIRLNVYQAQNLISKIFKFKVRKLWA